MTMPSSRALALLAEARKEMNLERSLELIRLLRPVWAEPVIKALERGGRAGALEALRQLFALGVFDLPPLSGPPYAAWRLLRQWEREDALQSAPYHVSTSEVGTPVFSVLMPVFNPDPAFLRAALNSLLDQTFPAWELCLVDDASTDARVAETIREFAAKDGRIRPFFRENNGHISVASNDALSMAKGQWSVLVDHDDLLPSHALAAVFQAAASHPEALVLFSDEDRVEEGEDGPVFSSPLFKHGFDPDLLLACNVVSHLGVYRTSVLREENGFRPGLEGAQDHDLALRILQSRGAGVFCHIPDILYHWRRHEGSTSLGGEAKPYAAEAAMRARRDFAGDAARFADKPGSSVKDVHFVLKGPSPRLVVLLLAEPDFAAQPASEQIVALERWKTAAGCSARIVLVPVLPLCGDEGGTCSFSGAPQASGFSGAFGPGGGLPAWEGMREVGQRFGVTVAEQRFLPWPDAANMALSGLEGDVVALADIADRPHGREWAASAVSALWREGIAAVGCRSLNHEGFLLQSGYAAGFSPVSLAAGMFGVTGDPSDESEGLWLCPAYAGLHADSAGYYSQAHLLRRVPGVYHSGMFIRRAVLETVGGFSPETGNQADVDFCLRAWSKGLGGSLVVPAADLRSVSVPVPVRAPASMQASLAGHAVPCQNPWLDWTAGGWRLRGK